jgi:transposase
MRLAGASYPEIVAALGVAKSTVSLWVRDVPYQERLRLSNDARRTGAERYSAERRRVVLAERQNEKLAWANKIGELTDRELLIAGAVAYSAEEARSKPWRPAESSSPTVIRE